VWRDFRPPLEKLWVGAKYFLERHHGLVVSTKKTKSYPAAR